MTFSTRLRSTIAVLFALLSISSASPAKAEILSGCVAPEDAGVTQVVGWVDVGVMLGMADPEPPTTLQVTDPNGAVVVYRDGLGLLPPTGVLPIWFAPAPLAGDYELVIDGSERCTVSIRGQSDSPLIVDDEIKRDWASRSAPAKGN